MFIFASLLFQSTPDLTDLTAVLLWLTGLGAVYLTGKLFAFVAENFAFWHKLPSQVKFIIPIGIAVAVGLVADQLLLMPDFLARVAPMFTKVTAMILLYLGSQQQYREIKADQGEAYGDSALKKGESAAYERHS